MKKRQNECPVCGKRFRGSRYLAKHILNVCLYKVSSQDAVTACWCGGKFYQHMVDSFSAHLRAGGGAQKHFHDCAMGADVKPSFNFIFTLAEHVRGDQP